jgi:SAM-dependent methyltransferase
VTQARSASAAEHVGEDVERGVRRSAEVDPYLERNRRAWERWAPGYFSSGRRAWEDVELHWGIWGSPESELGLFASVQPNDDVIELGCGTAEVSAWLARRRVKPVALDFSRRQLRNVETLQKEFGVRFPLAGENAEDVLYDGSSFDVAVSDYGASLWSDPRVWLPEANRILRPEGLLVFVTTSSFLYVCTPADGSEAGTTLVRDYFSAYRLEFDDDGPVEFHPTHGQWIRLLGSAGFALENLIEIRPGPEAQPRFDLASLDWARRWPSEEVWIARKMEPAATA